MRGLAVLEAVIATAGDTARVLAAGVRVALSPLGELAGLARAACRRPG